jgi:23S rRNA U2552 (ribose-2'-O)-methylase RlmE/FtsJ
MSALRTARKLLRAAGLLPPDASTLQRRRDEANRYRTPPGPQQVLPPAYFEPVTVAAALPADHAANDLFAIWATLPGGHKWLHYFEHYEALFAPLRAQPIRMLEIGVYRGGSLQIWRRYLHPDSVIVGIDIDETCRGFDDPGKHLHVRIGSQADAAFLASVSREFGPFDVILDDGSHVCSHMVASFGHLFLEALVDSGVYIAEDTHTNFWGAYRDQTYSFIDLCKDLVDTMHGHYVTLDREIDFRIGHESQRSSLELPRIAAQIGEISFRDSIVVLRKKPAQRLPGTQHN